MLTKLYIANYALIDRLELTPDPGLSIITGETGAGKSIMLDALSLLLGERADTGVIADREQKTVVEGTFTDLTPQALTVLGSLDVDFDPADPRLIARREITPSGRSRAFVNDTPVKLSDLASLTRLLVDIHSQHSNVLLSQSDNQLALVDSIAGNESLLADYQHDFRKYVALRNELRKEKEEIERARSSRTLYQIQLDELNELDPRPGELEEVERRFDILSDAEEIREHLYAAFRALSDEDSAALAQVGDALEEIHHVDMGLFEHDLDSEGGDDPLSLENFTIAERLRQVYVELKDIAETIGGYAGEVEANPAELARVSSRMNKLYEARRHFHVESADELVALREDLRSKLAALDGDGGRLADLEHEARALAVALKEKGALLSQARRKGGDELAEKVNRLARPLGLPNLHFEVSMEPAKLSREGGDALSFRVSFNKNMPVQEMAKVASGGEMARLMLCIKAIMAERMNLPTLIFDEIDTGVSGEIADKMGRMMREISSGATQVIAITHLPQVASKGKRHFKVFKQDNSLRTVSAVRDLGPDERVNEIAAMLSGEQINDAALEAARLLLADSQIKSSPKFE